MKMYKMCRANNFSWVCRGARSRVIQDAVREKHRVYGVPRC